MGTRRRSRELALQAVYISDVSHSSAEKSLAGVLHQQSLDERSRAFVARLVHGTLAHRDELDKLIVETSRNWEMKRMAALDRNILRLGAYELLHELDTPVSVIIDEAVEIAKTFSTQDSGKFVNGILDKIKAKRSESGSVHAEENRTD